MLSSNLPVSHDVYVHRTGQSSFRTKGVYPGLSTAPTRPGSWARLLCNGPGHTQHLQEQQREQPEPLKPPKRPACGQVPPAVPSLSVPELLSWTESEWCKLEKLLNSLRLNFPNQEREFKISWYMHTRGKKKNPSRCCKPQEIPSLKMENSFTPYFKTVLQSKVNVSRDIPDVNSHFPL